MEEPRLPARENAGSFFARRKSSLNLKDRIRNFEVPHTSSTIAKLRQEYAAEGTGDKGKPLKTIFRNTSALFSNITKRGPSQTIREQQEQERIKENTAIPEQPGAEHFSREQQAFSSPTSFLITQHRLMRPYGPPLPRSQTFGCLGNPKSTALGGEGWNRPVPGRPVDNGQADGSQVSQAKSIGTDAPISSSNTLKGFLNTPPLHQKRLQELGNTSVSRLPSCKQSELGKVCEARAFRQSGVVANPRVTLIKSQSEVFRRSHLPHPVHTEHVTAHSESDTNPPPRLDKTSQRRTRRTSNIPRAIQRTPSTRNQKDMGKVWQDQEARQTATHNEESPMKRKPNPISEQHDAFEFGQSTGTRLRNSINTSDRISSVNEQFFSIDESQDAALFSAAAAAKERRQQFGGQLGSELAASLQVGPEPGPEPGIRAQTRIPTPNAVPMASNSPEADDVFTRERQYRPGARMSLNYPINGARTPSYVARDPITTPDPPVRRKSTLETSFEQTARHSPTPLFLTEPSSLDREVSPPTPDPRAWADVNEILSSNPLPLARNDSVRGPMPTTWWLGRYTSVVCRLHTQELNKQIAKTTGAGVSELGINIEGEKETLPGMLDKDRREAAAIAELSRLCATKGALDSFKYFLQVKKEREERGGKGPSREQQEGAAITRRFAVDAKKMQEFRARAEVQRKRLKQVQATQIGDASSSDIFVTPDEAPRTGVNAGSLGKLPLHTDYGSKVQDNAEETEENVGLGRMEEPAQGGVRHKVTLFGRLALGKR